MKDEPEVFIGTILTNSFSPRGRFSCQLWPSWSIFSIRLTINTSFQTSKYKLLGRKSAPPIKGYFMLLKRKIWVSNTLI